MPIEDIFQAALKTIFMISLPVILVSAVAGTIVSALQSATGLSEPAASYAVRVAAVVVTLYLMFPLFAQSLVALTDSVLR